ncbi:MAG: class I SAM-dependent methyltransferase [Desulfobacterales bacterium]|nr:class I SAM-dependent methyltransferase [Desulfobacterales bacterium]
MEKNILYLGLKAGGAPVMWQRIFLTALPKIKELVPPGSHVLEVGYGDGLLTCWLCKNLGWNMLGLDMSQECFLSAKENSCRLGIENSADFICCNPEETWKHIGQYDAVFIKTVLYNAKNIEEYNKWLKWIISVLKPGGVLINFETGRANSFMQAYRKIRKRIYTDLCLYNKVVERLYDTCFYIVDRRYYGGWSQFLSRIPFFYYLAYSLEENMRVRHADNCFAVSIIAQKPWN